MVACERVIDGVRCTAERCRSVYTEADGRWVRKFCGPCAEKVAPHAIKNDEARRRNAELGKAVVKKTEEEVAQAAPAVAAAVPTVRLRLTSAPAPAALPPRRSKSSRRRQCSRRQRSKLSMPLRWQPLRLQCRIRPQLRWLRWRWRRAQCCQHAGGRRVTLTLGLTLGVTLTLSSRSQSCHASQHLRAVIRPLQWPVLGW